ncbi:MAG: ATP-binding cassette domain-containing protein [Rhodobacteraceae bacterium]|nr:ATP-binding cassette domain-containing protein [Paracoccaceae bacterium]
MQRRKEWPTVFCTWGSLVLRTSSKRPFFQTGCQGLSPLFRRNRFEVRNGSAASARHHRRHPYRRVKPHAPPQGRDIFPLLTVRENMETGFSCLSRDQHEIPDHIFDLFPVLREMINRRGGDLSGGQQQQLAIARALITRPKLLILDEPTEGIQPNIIQQIGEVIRMLRDQGDMAIILVEQFFEFAYGLADQCIVLRRGEIILGGARETLSRETLLAGVSV